jgi:hypothetical protein
MIRSYSLVLTMAVLVTGAVTIAHAAPERRLTLTWSTSEFLAVEGPRLRLQHRYDATAAPQLWLEAEHPSSLQLEANKTVLDDEGASGGRCVAFVDRLVIVIDAPAAATYQAWTRCFFPFAASWNHTEGFDPGDMRNVIDLRPEDKERAGKWVWVKGPQYQLKAGANTYVFDGYHGGAKLDRILLSRDLGFVPEGMGEAASVNIAAHRTGKAETRDLRLGPVAQWLRVEGLPAQGVTLAASVDAGKTWQDMGEGGRDARTTRLDAMPARSDATNTIRFRVQITRTDAYEPIVERLALVYVPGEEELLTVANKRLRLGFSPYFGSLSEMTKLGSQPVSYLASTDQQPLFVLFVQQPDTPETLTQLTSLDAELVKTEAAREGRRVTMDFALLEGKLLARVTVAADDTPLTRWNLRITNNSIAKVFGAQFPLLSDVRLGESPSDDVMVLPWWGAGSRTVDPSTAEWTPYRKLLNYPGAASMQWLDLHDPQGGLYVAAYDDTHHDLELGYTQNRGASINLTFKKSLLCAPGKQWECEYAVGLHDGDWHWGADRYREWAKTWQKPAPTPAWVADTDGWVMPDGANFFCYPNLPTHYRVKKALLDMNWMECWMQMTETESCCGQFHYPSPLMGTPEDFRWGVQGVHDLGGRVGFYINAQLYKPWHHNQAKNIGAVPTEFIPQEVLAPYDPQWAFRWQAKDFAGRAYDTPATSPFADGVRMNPASRGWQDHIIHWASDWYVDEMGTDCIYLDQLSAAPSLPVYDDAGSDYGLWGRGYQAMLDRLLGTVLPRHPNFVLSMEGPSELHGQQVATALYGTQADLFDCYHYTFPDQVLIDFGAYVNQWSKEFPGQKATYLNTFLMGTRFCEYPPDDFGRGVFALRRRLQSLTFRATYRDTVGVQASDPAVPVKRFELAEGPGRAVLVNVGNLQKKPGVRITADLTPLKSVSAAWVFTSDGQGGELTCESQKGTAAFEAPPVEAATAVFVERIGPLVERVQFPPNATRGARVTGSVTVLNLGARRTDATVSVAAPAGWKTTSASVAKLAPGESRAVEVSVQVPAAAARAIHDLAVVVKGSGGEDRRYVGLAVVPEVEIAAATVSDEGLAAALRNRSEHDITATASLDAFAGVAAPPVQTVNLAPGAEAPVTFAVRWPDLSASRLPQTVRLSAEAGGLRTVVSRRVGPTIVNGGFDMAVINTDKPEGWPVFGNRPDCVHVVTDNPFEGPACLRVDPARTAPNVDQIVTLRPNMTYKLSAAMRRSAATDNPTVWVGIREGPAKSTTYRLEWPRDDKTVNEWRVFATTFTMPPQLFYTMLYACNGSGSQNPIWIDSVKLERVSP